MKEETLFSSTTRLLTLDDARCGRIQKVTQCTSIPHLRRQAPAGVYLVNMFNFLIAVDSGRMPAAEFPYRQWTSKFSMPISFNYYSDSLCDMDRPCLSCKRVPTLMCPCLFYVSPSSRFTPRPHFPFMSRVTHLNRKCITSL